MRIVFVLHQFYPEFSGGTEHVALNLARSLQRAGHYVHVLACAMRPLSSKRRWWRITREVEIIHEVYHGVPITWIARKHLPAMGDIAFDVAPATVNKLSIWMRAQRFDLMHLFHAMRMSSAVLAAQQCKLPYVATVTDFFFGCYRVNSINMQGNFCTGPQEGQVCERDCLTPPWTGSSLLNRYQQAQALLQAAGERVVPSEYVAQYFRNAFPAMSWRVIPHGIDFLNLLPASRKDASCVEDKFRDFIVLGYLGSIIQPKGLHILLQALARTSSPRLRLRIVGGFYGDPVYKRDILRMIEADPRVQWEGQVDPTLIASELKQMDLLCLPSLMPETFSLVLHEAAVLQIPALVSDLGAQEHYINQHQSGRVIARGDIFAWSQALQEIASDPQQISAWRANIRMPYRIEEEAFFYESLYRQFITLS